MSGQGRFLVVASGICSAAGIALGCAGGPLSETETSRDPAVYYAFSNSLLTVKMPVIEVVREPGDFAEFAERYPWLPQLERGDEGCVGPAEPGPGDEGCPERRVGPAELSVREQPDTSTLAIQPTDTRSGAKTYASALLENGKCKAEAADLETIQAAARADAKFAALLREAERPGRFRFNENKPEVEAATTDRRAREARRLARLAKRLQEARLKLVSGGSRATGGPLPRETLERMLAELDESLRAVSANFVETRATTWAVVCDLRPTSRDVASPPQSWRLFNEEELANELRPGMAPSSIQPLEESGSREGDYVFSIKATSTPPVAEPGRRRHFFADWLRFFADWLRPKGPDLAPAPTTVAATLSVDQKGNGERKGLVWEEIQLLESGPVAFGAAPVEGLSGP